MNKFIYLFIFLFSLVSNQSMADNLMILKLEYGDVEIELYPDQAPNHVQRFKELSNSGKYDGVVFHRVISGFMAQSGDVKFGNTNDPSFNLSLAGTGGSDLPDLKAEFNDIPHTRGILSAARSSNPDSANSQFFICFESAPFLDRQYSVFGKVIEGMDIVNKIEQNDTIRNISIVRVGREAKSFKASKVFSNHFKEDELEEERKKQQISSIKKEKQKEHKKNSDNALKTDSGLKYLKTYNGQGEKVNPNNVIMAHYAVYFSDGSLLDTSIFEVAEKYDAVNVRRKQSGGYSPLECRIGPEDPMIPGFKEGLSLLNIGDKATLFIPYYLAYGETGRGNAIPPKSDLIFEVEIVEMK